MRIWLNNNVLLPASDLIRGRRLGRTLNFLEKSQHWSLEQLQFYQLKRLNHLLKSSYEKVAYYTKLIDQHLNGSPYLNNLSELSRLPLLTKDLIRANYPNGITMTPLPKSGWRFHKTGGSTTGEPLVTIEDDSASDFGRASFYRAWNWMGWQPGAPALKIWGRPVSKLDAKDKFVKNVSEYFMNMPTFNAFQMDEALFKAIRDNIHKRKVEFIYGYATAIDEFAKYALKNNLRFPSVNGIMTTAEVLYPEMRERITNAFNAPVYNGYACGEINGVAYQKDPETFDLLISMERVIVEIVDEQGHPLPDGEPGMIALTDLHKTIMPLIRYTPGDEGVIECYDETVGDSKPRLTSILGRTCDVVEGINGKNVHSYFFARFFSNLDWSRFGLKRFQIIQHDHSSLDLYLEIENIPPEKEIFRLKRELEQFVGKMDFKLHWNEGLEQSKSGKLRWTINKMRV